MSVGIANLSQEIINLIAIYLRQWELGNLADISGRGRTLLPGYATISQSWQYAIESSTFRSIAIKSTEIDDFSRIMVNHRRKLLRSLNLNVILPTYTDKACAKFETEMDKQTNNQVFSKAIKDLLAVLRSWHDDFQATGNGSDAPIEQPIHLCIADCYSPKDCRHRGWDKYQEDREECYLGRRHDLFQHRYESSLLQLESVEGIQEIPQISSFNRFAGTRHIEPRSLAVIASKFPNLDSLCWRFKDNERRDPQSRQQTRFGGPLLLVSRATDTAT